MADSIPWSQVADLYDQYVRSDFDVPFWLEHIPPNAGDVLELMSGTGRVSIPLLEAGVRLTCVDNSPEMLAVLGQKIRDRGLAADLRVMDVRALDLGKPFDLIFVPFHALSELLSVDDLRRALAGIFAHLKTGGRFICTLHNPRVRLKTVDDQLHLVGAFPSADLPAQVDGGRLLVWIFQRRATGSPLVEGWQLFEEYDGRGVMRSKRLLEIRFRLIERDEFEALAREAGFRVAQLYGNYHTGGAAPNDFNPESSPFMIWVLERPEA